MYETFSSRACNVMQLAKQEAQRMNHEYLATEHILLGLLKEGSCVAAVVLIGAGVDLHKARPIIEKACPPCPVMIPLDKLPLTPITHLVIKSAIEEAKNLGHNYVGTEHLLLSLLRHKNCTAARTIIGCGASLAEIRDKVLWQIGNSLREQLEPQTKEMQELYKTFTFLSDKLLAAQEILAILPACAVIVSRPEGPRQQPAPLNTLTNLQAAEKLRELAYDAEKGLVDVTVLDNGQTVIGKK